MFEDEGKGEEERSNVRLASVACLSRLASRTVWSLFTQKYNRLVILRKVNHILSSSFLPFLLFATTSRRPTLLSSWGRAATGRRHRRSATTCTSLLLFRLHRDGPLVILMRLFVTSLFFSALPAAITFTGFYFR